RDNSRCARVSRARSARSWRGLVIFSPVDRASRLSSPASTPIAALVAVPGLITSSQRNETNQRPAASCDTLTVDGAAPRGSGRDHTMSSGSVILARVSRPSRQRNALVVYSADRRERFLVLKLG